MPKNNGWVKRNADWFVPYVASIQIDMGLGHWEIELVDKAPDADVSDTADMAIWSHDDFHFAKLFVADKVRDHEMVRNQVVHELLHLHVRDLWLAARSPSSELGMTASMLYNQRLEHEMEKMVESITVCWCKALDLPKMEWGSSDDA